LEQAGPIGPTFERALSYHQNEFFLNCGIFLNISVSTAPRERSFSRLKLIRNYLISTANQE